MHNSIFCCTFALAKLCAMRRILFFLLPIMAVVLNACKGGEEPRVKTAEATIEAKGGVYTLSNGVQLVVPAGAVDANTTVKVEYTEDLDESKGALPGDIYGQIHFSPEGLVFDKPIEVSMPLNQPAVEDSATILYWVADSARWYITDIGRVQGGKVTFYVDHFSDYAAEVNNWMTVFSVMDSYVGSASSEGAISEAVGRFLETELWEKMGIKDLRIATRVKMGGQAVNTCAQACGIYGFWAEVKDSVLVRQGGKMFKEESPCNVYTSLGVHTSYLSSHLYGLLQNGEKRQISDRLLEIQYKPCEIGLQGAAKDSKIEKGKTTEVTITALCGGEALADQLIQLQYSPELSCDVVNKKTDSNGQIKITVKGVEEGKGIVYAKAVSAVDADLVTEIQVPVKVGGADIWEVEFRLPVTLTSRVTAPDRADEGWGESIEIYDNVKAFSFSTAPKSVSFTIVGHARFKEAGKEYIPEAKIEASVIKGTSYVGIEEGSVSYDFPDFHTSWEYWYDGKIDERVEDYQWSYDVNYRIIKWPEYEFTETAMLQYSNRVTVQFYEGDGLQTLLLDSTMYTTVKSGTNYWYDDNGLQHSKPYSESAGPLRTLIAGTRYVWPSAMTISLEEGTFPLYHSRNTSPEVQLVKDNYVIFVSSLFADCFYDEMEWPYRHCSPKIEDEVESNGTITIRRIEEDEKE